MFYITKEGVLEFIHNRLDMICSSKKSIDKTETAIELFTYLFVYFYRIIQITGTTFFKQAVRSKAQEFLYLQGNEKKEKLVGLSILLLERITELDQPQCVG